MKETTNFIQSNYRNESASPTSMNKTIKTENNNNIRLNNSRKIQSNKNLKVINPIHIMPEDNQIHRGKGPSKSVNQSDHTHHCSGDNQSTELRLFQNEQFKRIPQENDTRQKSSSRKTGGDSSSLSETDKKIGLPFNINDIQNEEVGINFMREYFHKKEVQVSKSSQGSPFLKDMGSKKDKKVPSIFEKSNLKSIENGYGNTGNRILKRGTGSFYESNTAIYGCEYEGMNGTLTSELPLKGALISSRQFQFEKPDEYSPESELPSMYVKNNRASKSVKKQRMPDPSNPNLKIDQPPKQPPPKMMPRRSKVGANVYTELFKSDLTHSQKNQNHPSPRNLARLSQSDPPPPEQKPLKKYYFQYIQKYMIQHKTNKYSAESSVLSHLRETHNVIQNLSDYFTQNPKEIKDKLVKLTPKKKLEKLKESSLDSMDERYLILDIDETLVHSSKQRPVRIGGKTSHKVNTISFMSGDEETKVSNNM